MRHVLKTDGAWVELRDVEDLRAKDRKAVQAVVMGALEFDFETGQVATGQESVQRIVDGAPDAVARQLVVGWEIPYLPDAQLPRLDPDVLGELMLEDYDRLRELIAPAVALLMPGDSRDPSDFENPTSPSVPANG